MLGLSDSSWAIASSSAAAFWFSSSSSAIISICEPGDSLRNSSSVDCSSRTLASSSCALSNFCSLWRRAPVFLASPWDDERNLGSPSFLISSSTSFWISSWVMALFLFFLQTGAVFLHASRGVNHLRLAAIKRMAV